MTRNSKISVGLSVLAVVGVGLTAFFSAKNSKNYEHLKKLKCAEKWDDLTEEEYEKVQDEPYESIITKKEKAIIFGKAYWPTLVTGSITVGCIVGAQVIDIREILGLSAGLAAITYKYDDMKRYLQEKYPEQFKDVQNYVNRQAGRRAMEQEPVRYKE